MSKFKLLNPELRKLVSDDKIGEIEKAIQKYRILITSIEGETQEAIFQPTGQSLIVFADDEGAYPPICKSCEVPRDLDLAESLLGRLDQNEWEYIHPINGIENFRYYRIDYFHGKGKSVEAQVQRHNELIDAGLVDAVVACFQVSINRSSLVEIYAGERFDPGYE